MNGSTVSMTGIAAATGIVIWFAIHWWLKEGHKPKKMISFVFALAYGMLATLTVLSNTATQVSALGFATWLGTWVNGVAGYAGLVWGVGGSDQSVTRSAPVVLTPGGYVIIFFCGIILLAMIKFSKVAKGKVLGGFVSGCGFGLSGAVAGAAAVPLASSVNILGAVFTGAVA